mgnify:CR=1 FL=1
MFCQTRITCFTPGIVPIESERDLSYSKDESIVVRADAIYNKLSDKEQHRSPPESARKLANGLEHLLTQ